MVPSVDAEPGRDRGWGWSSDLVGPGRLPRRLVDEAHPGHRPASGRPSSDPALHSQDSHNLYYGTYACAGLAGDNPLFTMLDRPGAPAKTSGTGLPCLAEALIRRCAAMPWRRPSDIDLKIASRGRSRTQKPPLPSGEWCRGRGLSMPAFTASRPAPKCESRIGERRDRSLNSMGRAEVVRTRRPGPEIRGLGLGAPGGLGRSASARPARAVDHDADSSDRSWHDRHRRQGRADAARSGPWRTPLPRSAPCRAARSPAAHLFDRARPAREDGRSAAQFCWTPSRGRVT